MVYVKIVIGSLIWAVIFWNVGNYIFEQDRERICNSEVRKKSPDTALVKENCLATAEVYAQKEEYGSASWFYLLAGDLDSNLNEVEEKISNDFYVNIGHTYVLKNDFEKAEKIYKEFIFSNAGGYAYTDVNDVIMEDYETLNHLYGNEKERLDKGLALWNKVYAPVGKMLNAYGLYEKAESDYNTSSAKLHLKEAIGYAEEYGYEKDVSYADWTESLAELYYDDDQYNEAITYYTKASILYKDDEDKQLSYADSLFWIAKSHYSLSEYKTAIDYYKKSIPFYVEADSNASYNIGYVYHNIANSYREEENQTLQLKAITYYKKSIEHKKLYNEEEVDSLARSYNNMGDVYYKVEQYENAKKAHEEAIELEKQMFTETDEDEIEDSLSELDTLALYHQDLSDTYRALGDINASIEVQENYVNFVAKHYGEYKLTLAEAYESVANYFQYRNASLSFDYYQKGLTLLDKNNVAELLSEKETLRVSILEDMLYISEDFPDGAEEKLKALLVYQQTQITNKFLLAKTYFILTSYSKDKRYEYEKKSLTLLQEYMLEKKSLDKFSFLVKYYDKYIEAHISDKEEEKGMALMNEFKSFVMTHYSKEKSVQFEFYASRAYMHKLLANYESSIKDIIEASQFKDASFTMNCKKIESIYNRCYLSLNEESIPKLEKACETIMQ